MFKYLYNKYFKKVKKVDDKKLDLIKESYTDGYVSYNVDDNPNSYANKLKK